MRGLRAAAIAAAAWAQAPATAEEAAPEQRRIFEDHGNVTYAAVDDDGIVRIGLWEDHIRFRLAGEPAAKLEPLRILIQRADQASRAVALRYDGAKGIVDRETGSLEYPLCAVVMDDLGFEPARACETSAPGQPADPAAALGLANAHSKVGNYATAVRLLERADFPTDPVFRKLFLRVRAEAEEGVAATARRASPEADRALAAALADHRALAELEPDDVEHQLAIAITLIDLGGYAEADALYGRILVKWPDEEYRVAVGVGALHRYQGHYDKALDSLNQLVARNGAQPGMKFHYHRGWLLTLLGRYDEAIVEFTEGLRNQPDYSSAYLRRACALASVGRLRDALNDVGEAARLYATLPGAATSKRLREDIAEAADFRKRLEAAIAAGGSKSLTGTCAGPTWQVLENPRPRSPLLPAA